MGKPRSSGSTTPEEFEFETRLVVLNALGLVPSALQPNISFASSSATSDLQEVNPGSSGSASGSSDGPRSLSSSRDGATLRQVLPTLPETSLAEKLDEFEVSSRMEVSPVSMSALSSVSASPKGKQTFGYTAALLSPDQMQTLSADDATEGEDCPDGFHGAFAAERPNSIPLPGTQFRRTDPGDSGVYSFSQQSLDGGFDEPDFGHTPVVSAGHPDLMPSISQLDRQISEVSDGSLGSSDVSSLMHSKISMSSSRASRASNRVNIQQVDVSAMVKSHVLPPLALPLRDEINEEMTLLERNYEDAVKNGRVRSSEQNRCFPTPGAGVTTPESEVARWLGMIGDEVQAKYGGRLEDATREVLAQPREQVSYEVLQALAETLIKETSGWTRVALVLLFSQRISFGLLSRGERGIHQLVEYTSKILMDQAADFILSRGGWMDPLPFQNAIWELDCDATPSPVGTGGFTPSDDARMTSLMNSSVETVLPGPGGDHTRDSAISSGLTATLDVAFAPITRDDTMHSIASIANSELATPADGGKDFIDAPHDAEPEAIMPLESRSDLEASVTSLPDSGVGAATSSKRDSATEKDTRDIVDRLQPEIKVLRQASMDMSKKATEEKERYSRTTVLLTATGCALLAVSAIFLYKKVKS